MYKELIKYYYDIDTDSIEPIADHLETQIMLVRSGDDCYVLKEVVSDFLNHPENEGELTHFLAMNGFNVSPIFRTKHNEFIFSNNNKQFYLYRYVDGKILDLNTAPDWYLQKSARLLGQIQKTLSGYKELPILFDRGFFADQTIADARQAIMAELANAQKQNHPAATTMLTERLTHLNQVSTYQFDLDRLTYCNSHGDYYVSQIILNGEDFWVIDWTSACCLPACFEVLMSYTYAAPECQDGTIDSDRFKVYLAEYMAYFPLTQYDLKMMPYFYYYQLATCTFVPPYDSLPDDYREISGLCDRLMNWLCHNADILSEQLEALHG